MRKLLWKNLFLSALSIQSLPNCIGPKTDSSTTGSQDAQRGVSCFSLTRDSLALVNGQLDTKDDYSPVVELKKGISICTGTFVSHNTLLTAAHCVNPLEPGGGIRAMIKGKSVTPIKTLIPGVPEGKKREPKDDVAVVLFADDTSESWFGVSRLAPRVGQKITLVGFGQTDFIGNNTSDEKRRFGFNTIAELPDDGATIKYELAVTCQGNAIGQNAMAGRGDSGGPVFTQSGMVGIISRGEINHGKLVEYDANLVTPAMEKFLRSTMLDGAEIHGLTPEEKDIQRARDDQGTSPASQPSPK